MIIKKANIIAFGGLKNKVVEFENGINIIYGENETGKSTIQSFIKIMLYGFNNSRVKDLKINERLRYMPLSGEKIQGELYIEDNNKSYIIKRTFGNSKKDDTCIIINALTGEEVKEIQTDEPGKELLSVSRSTFSKTLFIGQLAIEVSKDKDEEIIDKILNSVGVGESDVTIDKAFQKLENYKKSLSTSRRTGNLDKLKERYGLLLSERYEGYNLSEQNLENEEALLKLKKERKNISQELSNLEIYKKYLKKVKLKKEFEELTRYLRKKEELQQQEKSIENEISYNAEVINLSLIDDLKEEYSIYLNNLEMKNDDELKLNEKLKEIEEIKEPLRKYQYIDSLDENISKELLSLKIEQSSLKEKIDLKNKIDNDILFLENKEKEMKSYIGRAYELRDIREDVISELDSYEEKLKKLKYIMENKNVKTLNKRSYKIILIVLAIIFIISGIMINSLTGKAVMFVFAITSIIISLSLGYISSLKKKSYIKLLKEDIDNIEKKLDKYNSIVGVNDFGQLYRNLKLYDEYVSFKEKVAIKIEEKNLQKQLFNLETAIEKYNSNNNKIREYLELSGKDNLDDLLQEIYKYEDISEKTKTLEYDISKSREAVDRYTQQLKLKEDRLVEKLKSIGLDNIRLEDVGEKLKELREKIVMREEVHRNLLSIKETYAALSKDKNIDSIKEDLKEIIDISFKYSYDKEDEVDDAVKYKSNRLLQIEKDIKDLENEIKNRFNGKREIAEIEGEIAEVEGCIDEEEKNLKAANIAAEVLTKSYESIRDNFGPVLNKKVLTLFKEFTNGRYTDVMVSDKYEIKVSDDKEIFSSKLLSNGANDQLYLALRLAFIEMIFKSKDVTLYLDDTFVQYDDNRVKNILEFLSSEGFTQMLIFTCHSRESIILNEKNIKFNYISI